MDEDDIPNIFSRCGTAVFLSLDNLDFNSDRSVSAPLWVCAHRLSTLNIADRIFVLDKGKIVEKGTFNQLMTKKGLFYNIHMLQMKEME